MTTRIYKSTDAAAPVLSGTTGSLIDLLYAVLVTGYGAIVAAGWTREFLDAASKTAVFRPSAGPMHYFQVQDAGPGGGSFREARCRGYVAMTAYNAGTEPFPTAAQMGNGLFIRKSATLDATARSWIIVADEKTMHLFIDCGDYANCRLPVTFGAFNSWKNADPYASMLAAKITENNNYYDINNTRHGYIQHAANAYATAYAPRSFSGAGTAVAMAEHGNFQFAYTNSDYIAGSLGPGWPNQVDGGMLLSPIWLYEGANIRGTIRGMWYPCHARPIVENDTLSAADGATVRDFIAINNHQTGQFLLETSNTLDTP